MPQRFTVPQFIDVEDKILGPITTRQFVVLIGAAMITFIGFKLFDFALFIVWGLFWIGGACIIAFMKVNGMPFHNFMLNIIQTLKRAPIRVWNKNLTDAQLKAILASEEEDVKEVEVIPRKAPLKTSSLSELSLIADTGGVYEGETVLETQQTTTPQTKTAKKATDQKKKTKK